jgi:hypothetical protein
MVKKAALIIETEMLERLLGANREASVPSGKAGYYVEHYLRSGVPDVTVLPFLTPENVQQLTKQHLDSLATIVNGMLQYKPFELVTIHDEFKAHPNNINWVRYQYKEIMAEIADSNLLDDLLSQLHGTPGTFKKLSKNLGELIRESAYGLC